MLYIYGIRNIGGIHHADRVENIIIIGIDGRWGACFGTGNISIQIGIDAFEFPCLIPIIA